MSSFTINKKEYVKAAGLVAGIAAAEKLWVYDYEYKRNMTPDDYYTRFVECYEMNETSVAEQYSDKTNFDLCEYKADFNRYMRIGNHATLYPEKLRSIIIALSDFFRSAVYQTENYSYMFRTRAFYDHLISNLFPLLFPHEVDSWGSLEI
jgi:hypothetical protein